MLAPVAVELFKQHKARQVETKQQAGANWQGRGLFFCTSLETPLNPIEVIDRFKALLKKANLLAIC